MMTLKEYLTAEGYTDLSRLQFQTIMERNMTLEQQEQFHKLGHAFVMQNNRDNIKKFYDYCSDNQLVKHLDSGLWARTMICVTISSGQIKEGMRVLDMGCGTGIKTVYYAITNPTATFYASDLRIKATRETVHLAEKYSVKNLNAIVADNLNFPFSDAFDLVISDHCLHETDSYGGYPDWENKIEEISRIIKPGGKAIVILSPTDPESLEDHLTRITSSCGLKPQFSRFDYTRYGEQETDIVMTAVKNDN